MKWIIFLFIVYGNQSALDAPDGDRLTRYLPGEYATLEECKVFASEIYTSLKGGFRISGLSNYFHIEPMCTSPEERKKIAAKFNIPSPVNGE